MDFKEPYEKLVTAPRDFATGVSFPDPARIKIVDCTLRDGEQMAGIAISPENKYKIIRALNDIGVHAVEIGFPHASADEKRTLQLAVQGKERGELREDLDLVVVCRSARADIDSALQALEDIDVDAGEVTFAIFTSGSDLHLKYKIGKTLLRLHGREEDEQLETGLDFFRDANVKLFGDAIRYARSKGTRRVQIVAEDVSRANLDYIIGLYQEGIRAGGFRPGFTDTVGCGIPQSIAHYARKLVEALPDSELYTHFHNDYGLATINTLTAMSQGVEVFSCTVNGIGERAGNASLHQVVVALRWLYGVELPGFKYEQLRRLSTLVERHSGIPLSVNEPVVGPNVFTHESGVHTAGVLIDPRIYEAIPATAVGSLTRYLYGKHSGTQIVQFALEKHARALAQKGITVDDGLVHKVTQEVKLAREQLAATDHAERIVDEVISAVNRLGLTDQDVYDIALAVASR